MDKTEIIKKWNKVIDDVLAEKAEYEKKINELETENRELLEIIERKERYINAFDKKCDRLQDLIDEMQSKNQ